MNAGSVFPEHSCQDLREKSAQSNTTYRQGIPQILLYKLQQSTPKQRLDYNHPLKPETKPVVRFLPKQASLN